jgi:ATP-dependent exoDNAse (exonuclease V) beta subunit
MTTQLATSLGALTSFIPPTDGASVTRLSREQLDVITETDTHLVVEAGAGAGKTTTLVEKILYEIGCSPLVSERLMRRCAITEIGAITFTNKAAGELSGRIQEELLRRAHHADGGERQRIAALGHDLGEARLGTIDAFAGRLLNEYGTYGGFAPYFDVIEHPRRLYASVADESMERGLREEDSGAILLARHFGPHAAREFLADAFSRGDLLVDLGERLADGALSWETVPGLELTPVDRILESRSRDVLEFALRAYQALEYRMMVLGAYDHTQIMMRAAKVAEHPFVQAQLRAKVRLLVVDEHQDTNLTQCRLLFRLAGLLHPAEDLGAEHGRERGLGTPEMRLVLIGDPKQSIYAFRGSDVTLWQASSRLVRSAGGRCLTLSENYRTRPTVSRFFDSCLGRIMSGGAASSRDHVPYRRLIAKRRETPGPGVEFLLSERAGGGHSAEVVAERIAEMLRRPHEHTVCERLSGGVEFPRAIRAGDIAILARTMRGVVERYVSALRDRGVPVRVLGGQGLFARREVQDLILALRALADRDDSLAMAAFLRSPLGDVDDVTITELATASRAGVSSEPRAPLYEALGRVNEVVSDPVRAERVQRALVLLHALAPRVDRIQHHELVELIVKRSDYESFLAGAPEPMLALQNVRRFVSWLRDTRFVPLRQLVSELEGRVAGSEYDEEVAVETDAVDAVTISTIHRAKGLEWPVVFVVGLEEAAVRQVRPDRPRLDPELGVVLPLEVFVTGADGVAQPTGQASAAWDRHGRRARLGDYAEAKRIFYVGCTRARDRLVLAGALTHDRRPASLDPQPEWMHRDGVERWLRFLYPELTRGALRRQRLAYGPPVPAADAVPVPTADFIDVRRR